MRENEINDASVLPTIFDDGSSIVCTSIAGGARYVRGMPQFLFLTHTRPNGDEIRAEYVLKVSSISKLTPTNPPEGGEKEDR